MWSDWLGIPEYHLTLISIPGKIADMIAIMEGAPGKGNLISYGFVGSFLILLGHHVHI
jgi:hypothetical protein